LLLDAVVMLRISEGMLTLLLQYGDRLLPSIPLVATNQFSWNFTAMVGYLWSHFPHTTNRKFHHPLDEVTKYCTRSMLHLPGSCYNHEEQLLMGTRGGTLKNG
jgi:hypothetical protein